jgi:hypothetical protein
MVILGGKEASLYPTVKGVGLYFTQKEIIIGLGESLRAPSAVLPNLTQREAAKPAQGIVVVVADNNSLVLVFRTVKSITVIGPAAQVIHDGFVRF